MGFLCKLIHSLCTTHIVPFTYKCRSSNGCSQYSDVHCLGHYVAFTQNCYTIRTKELICMWAYLVISIQAQLNSLKTQVTKNSLNIAQIVQSSPDPCHVITSVITQPLSSFILQPERGYKRSQFSTQNKANVF